MAMTRMITAISHASAAPVTLTYWSGFTGGDKQAYEDLIKKFNTTHTDIQIDYQEQPWDSIAQKLPTAIISGAGPDTRRGSRCRSGSKRSSGPRRS